MILAQSDRAKFKEHLKAQGFITVGQRAKFELPVESQMGGSREAEQRSTSMGIVRDLPDNAVVFMTFVEDAYSLSCERIAAEARSCGWFDLVLPPYTRADAEGLVCIPSSSAQDS